MIIDEGSVITDGIIPGMDKPVAIVGVAEKGYASFELICNHESGHSSMPNNETTIGMLAKAIVALETNKMPAELTDPVISFYNFLVYPYNFSIHGNNLIYPVQILKQSHNLEIYF